MAEGETLHRDAQVELNDILAGGNKKKGSMLSYAWNAVSGNAPDPDRVASSPDGVGSSGNKRGIAEANKAPDATSRNAWGTLNDPRTLIQKLPEKHATYILSKPQNEWEVRVHTFLNDVLAGLPVLQRVAIMGQPTDFDKFYKLQEYLHGKGQTLDTFKLRN